jgi:hypothetical protein
MSSTLRRIVPALRVNGVEVEFQRESSRDRRRLITIRRGARWPRPR